MRLSISKIKPEETSQQTAAFFYFFLFWGPQRPPSWDHSLRAVRPRFCKSFIAISIRGGGCRRAFLAFRGVLGAFFSSPSKS